MNKLKDFFNGIKEKWTGLSKTKKIVTSIIIVGIIGFIVALSLYVGKTKYAVLFSNLGETDSGVVLQKLKDKKVEPKVEGGKILVPKEDVDKLRMEMLSEVQLTNGSQGFEILDKGKFGQTDKEMEVNYQRALQGELERTIKSFPQVENCRVHLVLPEETAFVKETNPGRASVTLNLKQGQTLKKDQVKAIIALVSGSVKNIPNKNVEVIDNKMTLLSKNLYDENGEEAGGSTSTEKQQQLKKNYEKNMQDKVLGMLEAIYGKDKVKVNINSDLDFDSTKTDSTTYGPKSLVVSEHSVKEKNTSNPSQNNGNGSAVDNNMVNNVVTNNNGEETSTRDENTKNYDNSKTNQKTIKAPGAVKRLTASVALDGNIDQETKTAVTNLVNSAIGYDAKRGDTINVEGIPFDTTSKDDAKKDLEDMQKMQDRNNKIKLFGGIGAGAALLIALIVFIILKKRRDYDDEEYEDEGLDVTIGDEEEDNSNPKPKFKPIELENENEQTHIENEIRKYAKEKPDQVVDIIKSWLAEDER